MAEEAGCVVGTVLSDDLGVGTVAEERLSPIFSWVVEYFLVETSMHCFWGTLEPSCSSTFLHFLVCVVCTVPLETEHSFFSSLLPLSSSFSHCPL